MPGQRAAIEKVIAPFREHLANLQAGKTFFAGSWRSREEMRGLEARAAESARLQALSTQLVIPLDAQIISANAVNAVLAAAGIALAVPMLFGVILVLRRKRWVGALCILLPVAAGIYYAFLLDSSNFTLPTEPDAAARETASQVVVRVLEAGRTDRTAPVPLEQRNLHLGDATLNAFLEQHMRVRGGKVVGAVNLRDLAVKLTGGGVTVLETAEWRGRPLLIRQNFRLQTSDGRTVFSGGDMSIGEAPLPGQVQRALRDSLVPQLARYLDEHDPLAAYSVAGLNPGSLDLASTAPIPAPLAQATPTPTPAAPGRRDALPGGLASLRSVVTRTGGSDAAADAGGSGTAAAQRRRPGTRAGQLVLRLRDLGRDQQRPGG